MNNYTDNVKADCDVTPRTAVDMATAVHGEHTSRSASSCYDTYSSSVDR